MNKLRIGIIGSRTFEDLALFFDVINDFVIGKNKDEIIIVSGGCKKGADFIAKGFAKKAGYEYKEYSAEWDKFGKAAGFIRNEKIIVGSDIIIAFWDGRSKGTKHSIDLSYKHNKQIYIQKFSSNRKLGYNRKKY